MLYYIRILLFPVESRKSHKGSLRQRMLIGTVQERQEDDITVLRLDRLYPRICHIVNRVSLRLGFEIEERTLEALKACYPLLGEINPAKLEEEERKGWIWRK